MWLAHAFGCMVGWVWDGGGGEERGCCVYFCHDVVEKGTPVVEVMILFPPPPGRGPPPRVQRGEGRHFRSASDQPSQTSLGTATSASTSEQRLEGRRGRGWKRGRWMCHWTRRVGVAHHRYPSYTRRWVGGGLAAATVGGPLSAPPRRQSNASIAERMDECSAREWTARCAGLHLGNQSPHCSGPGSWATTTRRRLTASSSSGGRHDGVMRAAREGFGGVWEGV